MLHYSAKEKESQPSKYIKLTTCRLAAVKKVFRCVTLHSFTLVQNIHNRNDRFSNLTCKT